MEKGKRIFTMDEYKRLRELVSQLEKADRQKSKSIRGKLRDIGLYWSEVANGASYTVQNFDLLFKDGTLKISGGDGNLIVSQSNKQLENSKVNILSEASSNVLSEKIIDLIHGQFRLVRTMQEKEVPNQPGLYCIKLKEQAVLPTKYGEIRNNRIIYIGKATKSLRERLWEEEIHHKRAATFFRSIGAMLGFLPPKGSLYGKTTRNYKFSKEDTLKIIEWMENNLLVNFLVIPLHYIDETESFLITEFKPLVNIQNNPTPSEALIKARQKCVEVAKSK